MTRGEDGKKGPAPPPSMVSSSHKALRVNSLQRLVVFVVPLEYAVQAAAAGHHGEFLLVGPRRTLGARSPTVADAGTNRTPVRITDFLVYVSRHRQ